MRSRADPYQGQRPRRRQAEDTHHIDYKIEYSSKFCNRKGTVTSRIKITTKRIASDERLTHQFDNLSKGTYSDAQVTSKQQFYER